MLRGVLIYGLVFRALTPQQQPGSYRGGDNDGEMLVSLVEETGAPGGNYRPTTSNWQTFTQQRQEITSSQGDYNDVSISLAN